MNAVELVRALSQVRAGRFLLVITGDGTYWLQPAPDKERTDVQEDQQAAS